MSGLALTSSDSTSRRNCFCQYVADALSLVTSTSLPMSIIRVGEVARAELNCVMKAAGMGGTGSNGVSGLNEMARCQVAVACELDGSVGSLSRCIPTYIRLGTRSE